MTTIRSVICEKNTLLFSSAKREMTIHTACPPPRHCERSEAIHARTLDCFTLRVRNDVHDNLNCTRSTVAFSKKSYFCILFIILFIDIMAKQFFFFLMAYFLFVSCERSGGRLTDYVNPFLGTATLWDPEDLGYTRRMKARTWGAEVFPGASLPNAMVQLSPVTQFGSGAGYQYEDSVIYGFSHTNKGHWNLLHIPLLPVTGAFSPGDYCSTFSHDDESARPGYYQVFLERYGVNVELTSTLRCGYHKYTFDEGAEKKLLADMTRSNNRVTGWEIRKAGENVFAGFQNADGRMCFYAVANYEIEDVVQLKDDEHEASVVNFRNSKGKRPLELKIGFSFVSIENARMNLEREMQEKDFSQVCREADETWEKLLSRITVSGGTEREKGLFYSCLYRSFLWPALRSDVNFDYTDARREVANGGFHYYTDPSFWDDYRNKLILLGMLSPDVTVDVVKSMIDRGEKRGGYMPTFFHGDHASVFVAGTYFRGIKGFDLERAYRLLLKNATVPGRGGRPYLEEYMERGWIAEKDTTGVPTRDEYKAAVTKTVEYAYDDYAVALIARELGDGANYRMLTARADNYKNLFDPSTGFWRGRIDDGSWIEDFDPYYPYYAYMYREANAWQSLFFAPHDPTGMLALYPSREAVEKKLDSLFSEPWRGYEAHNMTGFIGNYCHGNQPDHSVPYTYYFAGKQEKAQVILDSIMNHYYDMGAEKLAYAGMDDAGEMSSWYVFNAIGLYTYSPADPEYIVSVPLFDRVAVALDENTRFTVTKNGDGKKIAAVTCGGEKIDGWFIPHDKLREGKEIVITVE
jgi:predicted alpha-1,2-mannosidase